MQRGGGCGVCLLIVENKHGGGFYRQRVLGRVEIFLYVAFGNGQDETDTGIILQTTTERSISLFSLWHPA